MSKERRRHNLYEEAKQVFSQESADEFMSYFPPVGWADVATKADLGIIRNEMDALRAELRGEMAELRGEMKSMRADNRADLAGAVDKMRVWTTGTMIALSGVFAAIAFGAARLAA
jgi:hypothetical protein